jgi:hypothetical protein
MNDNNQDASSESSQSQSSYNINRLTRRTVLRGLGLTIGGLSLMGMELLQPPKAEARNLEAMDDPTPLQESSTSSPSPPSSPPCCSSCGDCPGSSGSSGSSPSSTSSTYSYSYSYSS